MFALRSRVESILAKFRIPQNNEPNLWQFESLPSTIPRKSEIWHTISISKPVILEIDYFSDSCACSQSKVIIYQKTVCLQIFKKHEFETLKNTYLVFVNYI